MLNESCLRVSSPGDPFSRPYHHFHSFDKLILAPFLDTSLNIDMIIFWFGFGIRLTHPISHRTIAQHPTRTHTAHIHTGSHSLSHSGRHPRSHAGSHTHTKHVIVHIIGLIELLLKVIKIGRPRSPNENAPVRVPSNSRISRFLHSHFALQLVRFCF